MASILHLRPANKQCSGCGANLIGSEARGDKCNECLDRDIAKARKAEDWEADWRRYENMGGAVMDCYRGW